MLHDFGAAHDRSGITTLWVIAFAGTAIASALVWLYFFGY